MKNVALTPLQYQYSPHQKRQLVLYFHHWLVIQDPALGRQLVFFSHLLDPPFDKQKLVAIVYGEKVSN